MTDADAFIRRIHHAGKHFVLAVTGGGSGAISALLRVPGASRSILDARVPYSEAALIDLLGSKPEQFCCDPTARALAMACWLWARQFAEAADADSLVGLGCTASLASDRPKKGAHRAYLAIQTAWRTATASIELTRDARTRGDEEAVVATIALNLAAEAAGLVERLELPLLPGEQLQQRAVDAPRAWHDLMVGLTRLVAPDSAVETPKRAFFPGAFNPLHYGHREMAELARSRLHVPVHFELSIENVDKPPLDFIEIDRRAAQFDKRETLWLTRAATFVEKSRLFPGATFIVGADTIVRIGQPRYYDDDSAACEAAICEIAANGCRFLVFPRAENAALHTLAELKLPPILRRLCDGIPPAEFRVDVSSTELRRASEPEN
jgi:nicotinic acid mononucleotide adenylyltransferase